MAEGPWILLVLNGGSDSGRPRDIRQGEVFLIARSLPDSTCKGTGDTGTGEEGTKGSMWSVCAGTAKEEGMNEVLGAGCGDEGVPCETDDRDGPGDDVLKHKGGSEGCSELPTIEPLLL